MNRLLTSGFQFRECQRRWGFPYGSDHYDGPVDDELHMDDSDDVED